MVEPNNNLNNGVRQVKPNDRGFISIADFLNANKHLLDQENAA